MHASSCTHECVSLDPDRLQWGISDKHITVHLIPKHTAAAQCHSGQKTSQGRICFDTIVGVVEDEGVD